QDKQTPAHRSDPPHEPDRVDDRSSQLEFRARLPRCKDRARAAEALARLATEDKDRKDCPAAGPAHWHRTPGAESARGWRKSTYSPRTAWPPEPAATVYRKCQVSCEI